MSEADSQDVVGVNFFGVGVLKLIYESVDGVPGGADEIAASLGECGGTVCVEAKDDFCDCWGDGSTEYF